MSNQILFLSFWVIKNRKDVNSKESNKNFKYLEQHEYCAFTTNTHRLQNGD